MAKSGHAGPSWDPLTPRPSGEGADGTQAYSQDGTLWGLEGAQPGSPQMEKKGTCVPGPCGPPQEAGAVLPSTDWLPSYARSPALHAPPGSSSLPGPAPPPWPCRPLPGPVPPPWPCTPSLALHPSPAPHPLPGLLPSPSALTARPRPVPGLGEHGGLRGHAGSEGALGPTGGVWRQHPRPAHRGQRPGGAPAAAAQEPAVGPEAEPQELQARGPGGRGHQPAAGQPVPALRAAGAVRAGQEPHEAPGAAHHWLR